MDDIRNELEQLTEDEEEIKTFSNRKQEVWSVKRKVRVAFKRDLAPPVTSIDFYKIGRVLGKGAYGKVNLALHKLTRHLCAVKSINTVFMNNKNTALRISNEIFLLQNLRHPSLIRMFETLKLPSHQLIFTELCRGGDLLNYVRRRRKIDEDVAKVLFKQLIEGLQYMHSKNVVHRDIKLENILLDNLGRVRICDLGASKLIRTGQSDEEQLTECCGTPAYMAPEVVEAGNESGRTGLARITKRKSRAGSLGKFSGYSRACDIWSAGVVLYAMLYGTLPFKGLTSREVKDRVIKGKYILKRSVSALGRSLIDGMLCVDVSNRITLHDILQH